MQKVFTQNALLWIEGRRQTGVFLIWGPGIQEAKTDKILKKEEGAGKTDTAGKESANGAVHRFTLIYHNLNDYYDVTLASQA